jgi:hypothetical protein
VRFAEALKVEQVGATARCPLHRDKIRERADRCFDAVDALDVRARQHLIERRLQQLLREDVY